MSMERGGTHPSASPKVCGCKDLTELWHCFSISYIELVILSYKKKKSLLKVYFMQYSEVHTEDTKKKIPHRSTLKKLTV